MTSVTAERGAAFLDERVPGWADMIDLGSFNLEKTCDCVIGQIERRLHPRARGPSYDAFWRGLDELHVSDDDAHRYGFYGTDSGLVGRTWRKLIRARQTDGDHS